jgi:hypothetical protein
MFIEHRLISTIALALLLSACGQSGGKSSGDGSSNSNTPAPLATAGASDVAADDCNRRISATIAASVLGVAKTKENPYFGHTKQPPNEMDVLECGYSEASPDPYAPFMKFVVFTPGAEDVASVYSSMSAPAGVQTFDTHVGAESFGWIRPGVDSGLFEAHITFRTTSNIFQVQVGGLHGADAATGAALKLAATLS